MRPGLGLGLSLGLGLDLELRLRLGLGLRLGLLLSLGLGLLLSLSLSLSLGLGLPQRTLVTAPTRTPMAEASCWERVALGFAPSSPCSAPPRHRSCG